MAAQSFTECLKPIDRESTLARFQIADLLIARTRE